MPSKIRLNINWVLYGRYLLLLALFALLILYGKNIPPSDRTQIGESGTNLSSQSPDITLIRLENTEPGQVYRVTYALKNVARLKQKDSDVGLANIEVWSFSDFSPKAVVKSYSIGDLDSRNYRYYESIVQSRGRSMQFGVQLTGDLASAQVKVKEMRATLLGVNSLDKASALSASIMGQTDLSLTALDFSPIGPEYRYDIVSKGKLIGQEISISEPVIVNAIELGLGTVGNGGAGRYTLEIRPTQGLKSYDLGTVTADLEFTVADLLKSYSTNDPQTFKLPISANLKPGLYFVGINSKKATFNLLNHLQLIGSETSVTKDSMQAMTYGSKTKNTLPAEFPVRLYSSKFTKINGFNIGTGTVIQDVGGGVFDYLYAQQGDINDYLDYLALTPTNTKDVAGYDMSKHVISSIALAEGSQPITYRFVFPYQLREASLEVDLIGGFSADSIYYSSDNVNWLKSVNTNKASDASEHFRGMMNGAVGGKILYVKIDPKLSGWPTVGQKYGLSNLKFHAQLKAQ